MEHFDLVVLGCGPAGERGAVTAAVFGRRVLVVDRGPGFGGALANTGTLPSKTLRETALYLSGFRARGLYGVEMKLDHQVGVQELLHRERAVRAAEQARIAQDLAFYGVEARVGTARFDDAHTVLVEEQGRRSRATASHFLIATGSHPLRPPLFPFDAPNVFDSDGILELPFIPRSMAVVGGGVIGSEYACTFAALGLPVTVIDPRLPLLPFLDHEMATLLLGRMASLGIRFRVPDTVEAVRAEPERVTLKLRSGESLEAASVLVAAGRAANSSGLGLEALGVALTARGHVVVNEDYQTTVPHIYAAGDVVGFPALASTSMEQARLAVVHALGLPGREALAPVLPYALYTIPELSMAGETEQQLQAQGRDYVVGRAYYRQNPRGQIIGDRGILKLLFRRDDLKLLGVHVLGEQASELVHLGLLGLLTEARAELFTRTCFNVPTLSDAYKYATYDAILHRQLPNAPWRTPPPMLDASPPA